MTAPALDGATAVVTGASRGIGLAIARALAGAGARVILLARSASVLEREVAALGAVGGGALAMPCDLADPGAIDDAVARLAAVGEVPTILVHNAGAFALGRIGDLPADDAARLFALNLVGPYRLTSAFVPGMRARGSGHVVTIGSIADRHTFPENAAYAASKFGARAMHQVLRDELKGSGVRASLVSPAPVDTALWDPIDPDDRAGFTPRAAMLRDSAVSDAVLWVVTRPPDVNIDELRLSRA